MKYNKKMFVCLMLIIISIISIIFINNKNTKKTFKYNGSDIALLVDGEVSSSFPTKAKYKISVTCENADGVWDVDNWNLKINNITGNVSCNISFDSHPSSLESIVNTTSTSGVASGDGQLYKSDYGVRYKGADPNNYIMFNGELYRIIGKLPVCLQSGCSSTQNRVKIIKEESIGALVFNANTTSSSVWETSTINLNLNNCFLGKINSRDNTTCANYCYSYYDSSRKPVAKCDYTQNGISTSGDYYNMIEDVYYNIGVTGSTWVSGKTQYDKEVTSHTTSAYKIGLMYASDYGYAQNGSVSKNYLFKNALEWTMSAYSSSSPVFVYYEGDLNGTSAYAGCPVRPVLYLKSNVYVISGDGSEGNPYKIMLG